MIKVAITVDKKANKATVDFTGTDPQRPGNVNAVEAVTVSSVAFALRAALDHTLPANAGVMAPVRVVAPAGSIVAARPPVAVGAGNVEVSQAVTSCLFGALKAVAASQSTMNNFNFGNAKYQYYETICGGSGAGEGFNGTSAVHTHMTNSRLTDPEVVEWRFPVLVEAFRIRPGSGGEGRRSFRGGYSGSEAGRRSDGYSSRRALAPARNPEPKAAGGRDKALR